MPNVGDLIAETGYKNGYVYFSTPETFANGNASIAVRNSKGVILWSWHIWCSEEGWNDHVYANNAGTMMDRNLGATSATPGNIGAFGLLYQWGRKDPFLGYGSINPYVPAVSTGTWKYLPNSTYYTIEKLEANPMSFSGWHPGSIKYWDTSKTTYDPCPIGYRVPDDGPNGFWRTAYTQIEADERGVYWMLADGTKAWYPLTGCRRIPDGNLADVGYYANYWSCTITKRSSDYDYYTCRFTDYSAIPSYYAYYAGNGYSVRCIKE
jgi:hypothetical protein